MKIKVVEVEGLLSIDINGKKTLLKKDNPINFQNLIDASLELKFNSKIEYDPIESTNVQNKVIIRIITQIIEKYNNKCDEYEEFKLKIDEDFKSPD